LNNPPIEELPANALVDMLFDAPQSVVSSFDDLLALWGVTRPAGSPELRCVEEIFPGFECMSLFGGWPRLRRYDLPAILEVLLPDGARRRAVLSGLDDETATLIINGRSLKVPITEIARLWDGSFILIWQPPIDVRLVSFGATGESVRWIQRALDRLDGSPESDVSGVFDRGLRQRVMDFQKKHSLIQDGLVGSETLARLVLALEGPESLSLTGRAQR
jgi:general secretion pathway protein A